MPRVFASSLARCLVATPLAAPVRIWPMRSDWRMERRSPGSGSTSLAHKRAPAGGHARRACGGAGAHLADAVGLEDGEELAGLGVEEHGVEAGAAAGHRVGLHAEGAEAGSADARRAGTERR